MNDRTTAGTLALVLLPECQLQIREQHINTKLIEHQKPALYQHKNAEKIVGDIIC